MADLFKRSPLDLANEVPLFGRNTAVDQAGQAALFPQQPQQPLGPKSPEVLRTIYGGEFTRGLRRGLTGLYGETVAGGGQIAEFVGADQTAQKLFDEARSIIAPDPNLASEVPEWKDVHGPGDFGKYFAAKSGEMLPMVGAGLAAGLGGRAVGLGLRALGMGVNPEVLGTVAGAGALAPVEFGSAALGMQNDPQAMANTTPGERTALAAGQGVVNSALMFAPQAVALRRAFAPVLGRPGLKGALSEIGTGAAEGSLGLGLASGLQHGVRTGVAGIANPERDTSQDLEGLKESVAAGMIGGLPFGVAGGLTHAVRGAVKPPELPDLSTPAKQIEAGYRTAKALDEGVQRAGVAVQRVFEKLATSVDKRLKASVEMTDAKRRMLEDLLAEDSPVREALMKHKPAVRNVLMSALDATETTPKVYENHPEAVNELMSALGVDDLNPVKGYLRAKATVRGAQQSAASAAEEAITKAQFDKLSPKEKAKRLQALKKKNIMQQAMADEFERLTPKRDEVTREDEGVPLAKEESGTDIKGDLGRLFPVLDKPITKEVLQESLQGENWLRRRKATDKTQASMPIYARDTNKENPLSSVDILKLFKLKDRDEKDVDILRDHTDEELADRSKQGYAKLHIRPWSLAQEVSRPPKRENFPSEEAFLEAQSAHFDSLPDYRNQWQKGTDNSRKGDLFMHSMTTLLNEGMDVIGPDGKTHHIVFRTGTRGLPENLVLGPVKSGGGSYTLKTYKSEKPVWTPKDAKALEVERTVAKEYEQLSGDSGAWSKKLNAEIAELDAKRRTAQKTDAYADINRRYQALVSLKKQRGQMAATEIMTLLRAKATPKGKKWEELSQKQQERIDAAINQEASNREYGIFEMVTKKEKEPIFARVTSDVHPLIRRRNARATVMDSMKTLYGALQDKVLDRLQAGERTPELIDHLQKYLDGEEASPALKEFFKDNGVPEYTERQLNHPSLKNEQGETPIDWLKEQLEWTKKRALEGEESGLLSEAEQADSKYGQRIAQGEAINPEVLKAARDLLDSIDKGTAPKNEKGELAASKLPLDQMARDLGLKISKETSPEQVIAAIRKAVDRVDIAAAQETRRGAIESTKTTALQEVPPGPAVGYTMELQNDVNMRPGKPGPFALKETAKYDRKTPEGKAAYEKAMKGEEEKPLGSAMVGAEKKSFTKEEMRAKLQAEADAFAGKAPKFVQNNAAHGTNYSKLTAEQKAKLPGREVELVRKPNNPADPNAIAIEVDGVHHGYVSREHAAKMAPRMDSGEWTFKAKMDSTGRFTIVKAEKVTKPVQPVQGELSLDEAVTTLRQSTVNKNLQPKLIFETFSRVDVSKLSARDKAGVLALQEAVKELIDVSAGKYNSHGLAQTTVTSWAKRFAGGTDITLVFAPKDTKFPDLLSAGMDRSRIGGMYIKIDGKHYIMSFEGGLRDKTSSLPRLAHEFGHALQSIAFDTAPKNVQDMLRAQYEAHLKEYEADPSKFEHFVSSARMAKEEIARSAEPILREAQKLGEDQKLGGDLKRLLIGEFEQGITNESPRMKKYALSFEEWFAEQFSKYVTSKPEKTLAPELRSFWSKLYDGLKNFYNAVIRQFKPDSTFEQWVDSLAPVKTEAKPMIGSKNAGPAAPISQEVAKRMQATIKQMFGKMVELRFDEPEGAKPNEKAWYVGRKQLDEYTANMARLKQVREARRTALYKEDFALAKQLEKKEEALLKQTQVVGLIHLSPRLAEREHHAALYHESTHAAFDILLTPEERATLATAFTKGTVANRLRELFKDEAEVLAHMKDAEEAAAYGFQIYATAPELLNLGGKVNTIFGKVRRFFNNLFGMLSVEEKAKIIMDNVLSGRLVDREISPVQRVLEKNMTKTEKVQKLARTMGSVVKAGWDGLATSSYERMIATNNPALAELAKRGYTKTGSDTDLGYIHANRAAMNRFVNGLDKTFKAMDLKDISAAAEARIKGEVPSEPGARKAYDALNRFFKEMHQYSVDAGVQIGFEKNYFPMGWNAEKVMNNREAFLTMLKKPEYAEHMAKLKVTPMELWENISNYVTQGESFQDIIRTKTTNEPANQYAKERSLSFLTPEDRRPFMEDNHLKTLLHYTQQMVRQAEYVRAFGNGGETMTKLLKEAEKKYGATPKQLAMAKDYVDGLLGDKAVGMSRAHKDLYGAIIVYENLRLLPLNLFSSLVDPLGIAVRSNSLKDAGTAFMYNMKNIFRDLKKDRPYMTKDKWEKLAEDWGVIEDAGLMSNIGGMYENLDIRGTSKTIQEAFFKYNLLNGWERNTKIMATKAAERFMLRLKEDFFGEHNERYLKELGLDKTDLVVKPDGELALRAEEMQAQGVSETNAKQIEKKLQDATVKFVNQSVLNPTAGDLPGWGSNPYYAPIFHLKQFMFTFQSTILRRIVDEAKQGNYKPMWTAGVYVPGMIGADMMRGVIQNYGSLPSYQKDWDTLDYIYNGIDRSGLTGTGSFLTDYKADVNHGGTGFESAMGPALEQTKQGVLAIGAGPEAKFNFFKRSLPGAPLFANIGMAQPRE